MPYLFIYLSALLYHTPDARFVLKLTLNCAKTGSLSEISKMDQQTTSVVSLLQGQC